MPVRCQLRLRVSARCATTAMLVALSFSLAGGSARAAIASGGNATGAQAVYKGNGELALMVTDLVAKVSYTLDLGLTQDDFFIAGQPDAGIQRFWAVSDERWASFLPRVDPAQLRWAVVGYDIFGSTAAGQYRWFTTVKQGDEANVATMTNGDLTTVMGRSTAYYTSVNFTGTHGQTGVALDFTVNGSSVNAFSDGGQWFGGTAIAPQMNNTAFNIGNAVGQSSWFYYLTRSSTNQLGTVLVDEFDNLGHDGYWGFTRVDASVASPYAGQYLLSYTLAPATTTQAQREFAAGIGRTERNGGFSVNRLPGVAVAAGETAADVVSRRLGAATLASPQALSAVPEPGSAALLLLGGAGLAAWLRRQRRHAAPCPGSAHPPQLGLALPRGSVSRPV